MLAAAVVQNGPAELVCGRVRVRCGRGARCSVRAVGRGELPDAAGRARPRPTERRPRRGADSRRVPRESDVRRASAVGAATAYQVRAVWTPGREQRDAHR